jgi:hypothetical protein
LLKALKRWDEAEEAFKEIASIEEFISFVKGIRNLFIHSATYIQIKSLEDFKNTAEGYTSFESETLTVAKRKSYAIDNSSLQIEALLDNFEKDVIKYFAE